MEPQGDKLRTAHLISGGGTTMQHILRQMKAGGILQGAYPALIIASNEKAGGILKAKEEGVPEKDILVIRRKDFENELAFGNAINAACKERGVDLICQNGWLAHTPLNVIEAYLGRMTNQHPGPIDPGRLGFGGTGMYGRRVHCARLIFARTVEGHLFTEATIQRVAPEYDEGMILASTIVPIEETDAVDDLQARVLPVEHKVSVEVILDYINGTVRERPRQVPLVDPEDHALLGRAKEIAIKLYPKG